MERDETIIALHSTSKARQLLLALEPEVRAAGYQPLQAEFWLKLGWVDAQLENLVESRGVRGAAVQPPAVPEQPHLGHEPGRIRLERFGGTGGSA